MKKYILFILLMICPVLVFAEDLEYHVCKEDCDYSELSAVFGELNAFRGTYGNNVTIYIDDAETYDLADNNYIYNKYDWVDSIYRSRFDKISIIGTNGAPKITTSELHQDFNYVDRSLFIEAYGDVTLRNIKIDVPGSIMIGTRGVVTLDKVDVKTETLFSYFTAQENVVKDLTINGNLNLNNSSNIKNSTINGELFVQDRLTADNITVNGFITEKGTVDIKNSTINAEDQEYGINFVYNDCLGDCGSSMHVGQNSSINNTVIKNAEVSAILYNRSDPHGKYQLKIDRVDMSSSPTSIIMYNLYSWGPNKFYDGYSVVVSNSKVAGAETYRALHSDWNDATDAPDIKDTKALNMFFDASNTWVKPIYRVNSPTKKDNKKANIVETDKGRIVIQKKKTGILVLKVDKDKPISEYFEEIGEVLGDIKVDDPSIVKVVNNKLVPLKTGTTNVRFVIDNDEYVLAVTVEGTNPDTVDKVVIASVLCVISIVLIGVLYKMNLTRKALD